MSTKRKFFFIFLFVLLNMFLLVSFLVIRDATRLNNLKKEVNSLSKLDVTKDRYNLKIKTSGKYGVVEKAIKKYLDEYAVLLQDTLQIVKDPKLTSILSYDNYKNDGPEFANSIAFLEQTKSELQALNTKYYDMLTDEKVLSYIPEDFDENYVNYYIKFTRKYVGENNSRSVEKSINTIIELLYKQLDILNYLKTNKKQWQVTDKGLSFSTEELTNTFNDKVKNI